MVIYPAGRAHDDMSAMAERPDLGPDRHTTTQRQHLHVIFGPCQLSQRFGHLIRQFPGGTKNKTLNLEASRIDGLDNRYPERRCLAAAGLRHGNHVLARQRKRNRLCLNRRRLLVTQLIKIGLHGRGKTKRFKR